VFVTHDQEEALDLADRVAILRDGKLIQLGKPQELYDHPTSAFVYDFLGPSCRLPGVVDEGRLRIGDWVTPAADDAPRGEVDVYFRPDEIEFAPADGAGLAAQVRGAAARGPQIRIDCLVEGKSLELQVRDVVAPAGVALGLSVRFRPTRVKLYPRSAEPAVTSP
jgi:sulfate/thiosulfate transport system ATP-binding protein